LSADLDGIALSSGLICGESPSPAVGPSRIIRERATVFRFVCGLFFFSVGIVSFGAVELSAMGTGCLGICRDDAMCTSLPALCVGGGVACACDCGSFMGEVTADTCVGRGARGGVAMSLVGLDEEEVDVEVAARDITSSSAILS
jgi:hypothetical protein